MRRRHPFCENRLRVLTSPISVANSKVSPAALGALINRKNSADLLQRYFLPRHWMSLSPLVDQFATEVKTAARIGLFCVRHKSVTTGCRVGSHFKPCSGTGKRSVPTFSPKVKRAQ